MNRKTFLLRVAAAAILAVTGFAFLRAAAVTTRKAYVIAEITVTDPQAFEQYAAIVPRIAAKYYGKFLVRGGQTVAVEGDPPAGRIVVIEFDSLAAARAYEDSPEYLAIAQQRRKTARSRVFIVEGAP